MQADAGSGWPLPHPASLPLFPRSVLAGNSCKAGAEQKCSGDAKNRSEHPSSPRPSSLRGSGCTGSPSSWPRVSAAGCRPAFPTRRFLGRRTPAELMLCFGGARSCKDLSACRKTGCQRPVARCSAPGRAKSRQPVQGEAYVRPQPRKVLWHKPAPSGTAWESGRASLAPLGFRPESGIIVGQEP